MNATKARLLTVSLALVAMAALAGEALATPAEGTNAVLASTNGQIYIPLKPATSGELGVGGVGLSADSVVLTTAGQTSSGYVYFRLDFDISAEVDPQKPIITSGTLQVTFADLDFLPVGTAGWVYNETLALTFMADAAGPANPTTLVLDESNYGNFRGDGFGPTNGQQVIYEFDLTSDLGVTPLEFADITADHDFSMLVRLTANVEHLRDRRDVARNTVENVKGNDFVFFGIPEPGAIVLLALGAVGLVARRRSR